MRKLLTLLLSATLISCASAGEVECLKEAINYSAKKATSAAAESSKKVIDHAVERLEESLPKIIEDSTTRSADRIAERLSLVPKTAELKDEESSQNWNLGIIGLYGLLFCWALRRRTITMEAKNSRVSPYE